jgi:hypothetical protein
MSTGAKIAIGCGVVVVVIGLAFAVGVVGLGFWAKGKVDALQADTKEMGELEKKADANPFEAPADGVIAEARLLKFLEARKQVFPVYDQYRAQFEHLQKMDKEKKKDANLDDVGKALGAVGGLLELRKAHLRALAEAGMSQAEYRYLVQAVYQSAWAAELEKSTGKTLEENKQASEEAMKQAARALEQQSQQPIDPSLPPEAQKALREAQEQARQSQQQLEKAAREAGQAMPGVDVPAANRALFRKYEADIKQYAMTGLEGLGF